MVPSLLLLSATVLAPVIGGDYGELTNGILQVLVFAGVCAFVLTRRREQSAWCRVPGAAALAVLLAASLFSLAFSHSLYFGLKQILFGLACIAAYLLTACLARENRSAAMILFGLTLAGLLICVTDIRDYALMTGGGAEFWAALLGPGEKARRHGGFVSPNHFAAFLVIAIPVCLALYVGVRRRALALVLGLAAVVMIASLGMTGSKAGALAGAGALAVFLLSAALSRSLNRGRLARLLVLAIIVAPVVVLFSSGVRDRVEASRQGGAQSHSEKHRLYTWKGTISMIKSNPWAGTGPGSFETSFPRYAKAGHTTHAHQSYLQIAAENGIFALGAFLLALGAVGIAGLRGAFSTRKDTLETEPNPDDLTWDNVLTGSSWRVVSCGLLGGFAGSLVTNLADSGWYVIGVALPFSMVAGVMASRAAEAGKETRIGPAARILTVSACLVAILLSLSFGLGDLFAPQAAVFQNAPDLDKLRGRYQLASQISPLNPVYPRELAKLYSADPDEAVAYADRAIRLGPTDAQSYYVRGIIARSSGNTDLAVNSFRQALSLKPHSTQVLYELAITFRRAGRAAEYEQTLRRLIAIEDTDYERVTGVPEMVDTRYARAHAYFAGKHLSSGDYPAAVEEYQAVVERLEKWRSYPLYIQVARVSGQLSADQEKELLDLLRNSYYGLAEAYAALGEDGPSRDAREKGDRVPESVAAQNRP